MVQRSGILFCSDYIYSYRSPFVFHRWEFLLFLLFFYPFPSIFRIFLFLLPLIFIRNVIDSLLNHLDFSLSLIASEKSEICSSKLPVRRLVNLLNHRSIF
ncbi:hypothetical protein PanWU01x14_054980 [Parasponia andersonii]|uniref:Uncharacterized protein n=1 Tax=Parasponia andersonii TaxID=3476 RepID=A0A2P5DL25_PARAD|nr:hypothetical protein PanWU01x14_054980 [Parasponia andersonii]